MKKIIYIYLIIIIVSCENLTDKKIIGRYYLGSIDSDNIESLDYNLDKNGDSFIELIEGDILELAYNDKYILLKKNRTNNIANPENDFYIVHVYKKFTYFPEKGIIGPLSYKEFIKRRKELGISDKLHLISLKDFLETR